MHNTNPNYITDTNVFKNLVNQVDNIDIANPNLESIYNTLEQYANYLESNDLDKSDDIELYSPILGDALIMKARISDRTKTTIKFDYSMFHIKANETHEIYVASRHIKTQSLATVFKKIFNSTKCFIVFDKFALSNDQVISNDNPMLSILREHYMINSPTIYTEQ